MTTAEFIDNKGGVPLMRELIRKYYSTHGIRLYFFNKYEMNISQQDINSYIKLNNIGIR